MGSHTIRAVIVSTGSVTTIAGLASVSGWSPDGPASGSILSSPSAIVVHPATGDVYWSESGTSVIRRLSNR